MFKLGLVINPIAGMGGSVGLKGTDGADALMRARALGALPAAQRRAGDALAVIADAMPSAHIIAAPGAMGADAARAAGFEPCVVDIGATDAIATAAEHTRRAVREMARLGVDLLLFAGGDGTARDVCKAMTAVAHPIPALGIPAGVKMHSAVFALTPRRAGETALRFISGEARNTAEREVMDIDEDAFRQGAVSAALYGYLVVPQDGDAVQTTKAGGADDEHDAMQSIAAQIVGDMQADTLYIIGPGTTTRAVADALGMDKTLLGVDVALNGRLVAADANEAELLRLTQDTPAKIVVGVIGGQGYIFGRGNQQLSARLIRQVGARNIIVAATRRKLLALGGKPLRVDTGDGALDDALSGYIGVVTGLRETHTYRVAC